MTEVKTEYKLNYEYVAADQYVSAIIVAAGNSTRMGIQKQFLPVFGIPVIARSMMCMQSCCLVSEIIVVARTEEIADIQKLAEAYKITKLSTIVEGGDTRQKSVENGVTVCNAMVKYFLIHDGARPLAPDEMIQRVIRKAFETKAAAAAVNVKDTIKRADKQGKVIETPERDSLYSVQTPQVIEAELYKKALHFAVEYNLLVTDDCEICEKYGADVFLAEGDYGNIKITTPEDIGIAEGILMARRSDSDLS